MEREPTQQAQGFARVRGGGSLKRILRVLEYTGTDEWLTATLEHRAVKGSRTISGQGIIREAMLGEISYYLDHAENVQRIFGAIAKPAPPAPAPPTEPAASEIPGSAPTEDK